MTRHVAAVAGMGVALVLLAGVAVAAPEARSGPADTAGTIVASTTAGMMPGGTMMHGPGGMLAQDEARYLADMIPHHEEAVAAARHLERSSRPEMRAFGTTIVRAQSAEIDRMRDWLARWYPGTADAVYMPMMRDLSALSADALDKAFLTDMIPHHMHAVMASQHVLRHGTAEHEEVAAFARDVRDVQRSEIAQMQRWLREWSG